MTTEGTIPTRTVDSGDRLSAIATQVSALIQQSRASNTVLAYQSDWRRFTKWCETYGKTPLPATPDTVALYLADLSSDLKPSTLTRHSASICQAHKKIGVEPPTRDSKVRMVMAGIRRKFGTERASKKALLVPDLKRMVTGLPDTLIGIRDRALILIGFCGAFRRSEIIAVDIEHVEISPEGLVVRIPRSKTDQLATGRRIGLPHTSSPETCPVRAFQRWVELSGITQGPLFRPVNRHGRISGNRLSGGGTARIIKGRVKEIGLDAAVFSGHSLRSGLATSAALSGAGERDIMAQTGHRSVTMVRRYIQAASPFKSNVVAGLGL
jgi:integrase